MKHSGDISKEPAAVGHERLRSWLLRFPDGAPLPPDRIFVSKLGLTPAEVRAALLEVESEGLIVRDANSRTFLSREMTLTEKLMASSRRIDIPALIDRAKLMDAAQTRLIFEPEIANLAALRRKESDVRELRLIADRMQNVTTWQQYAELDAVFHNSIGEMCGNPLLTEVLAVAIMVHFALTWERYDPDVAGPPVDFLSFSEHAAIIDAIEKRDGRYAAEETRKHLRSAAARFGDDLVQPR